MSPTRQRRRKGTRVPSSWGRSHHDGRVTPPMKPLERLVFVLKAKLRATHKILHSHDCWLSRRNTWHLRHMTPSTPCWLPALCCLLPRTLPAPHTSQLWSTYPRPRPVLRILVQTPPKMMGSPRIYDDLTESFPSGAHRLLPNYEFEPMGAGSSTSLERKPQEDKGHVCCLYTTCPEPP